MKLERAREMSLDEDRKKKEGLGLDLLLDERATMEMRVDLLNKQEMMRLQSNAELMKTLQDLSKQLKESTLAIQGSAREVKDYPVDVIERMTGRVEQTMTRMRDVASGCEQSASRAREVYGEIKEAVSLVVRNFWSLTLISGVVSSALTIVFVVVLKRFIS